MSHAIKLFWEYVEGTWQLLATGLKTLLMKGLSSIRPVRETITLVIHPVISSY